MLTTDFYQNPAKSENSSGTLRVPPLKEKLLFNKNILTSGARKRTQRHRQLSCHGSER
jgi:hypothetical protein